MSDHSSSPDSPTGDLAVAPAKPALRRPSQWQVLILNDDFTPMDFVVRVLMEIFDMPMQKAVHVMLSIHVTGRGLAGVYSKEIAVTKQKELEAAATSEGHPLQAVIEKMPGGDKDS